MALQTAWYWSSSLEQGGFLALFVAFPLLEMLRLLKYIAELGRIDLPTVGTSFGRQTRYVDRMSC